METETNKVESGEQTPNGNAGTAIPGLSNTVKRGRGRPPGSKNKPRNSSADVVSGPRNVSTDTYEDAKRDCEFFVETGIFLFESGDDLAKRFLVARIRRYVTEEQTQTFQAQILSGTFSVKDRERLRVLLTQLALKYPILRKVGPEIGLLVFATQYGLRLVNIARQIETLKPKAKPENN